MVFLYSIYNWTIYQTCYVDKIKARYKKKRRKGLVVFSHVQGLGKASKGQHECSAWLRSDDRRTLAAGAMNVYMYYVDIQLALSFKIRLKKKKISWRIKVECLSFYIINLYYRLILTIYYQILYGFYFNFISYYTVINELWHKTWYKRYHQIMIHKVNASI